MVMDRGIWNGYMVLANGHPVDMILGHGCIFSSCWKVRRSHCPTKMRMAGLGLENKMRNGSECDKINLPSRMGQDQYSLTSSTCYLMKTICRPAPGCYSERTSV